MKKSGTKNLSYEQRKMLADYLRKGLNKAEIAEKIGCCLATVYREIDKGTQNGVYDAEYSQRKYEEFLKAKGRKEILLVDQQLAEEISHYILTEKMSPGKIIRLLEGQGKHCPSKTTIYAAIDKGLIPNVTREDLHSKVTTMFSNGQIHVPSWIRAEMDIKDGDLLNIAFEAGKLIITK